MLRNVLPRSSTGFCHKADTQRSTCLACTTATNSVVSGAPRGCARLGTYPLVMRTQRACVCTQCPAGIGSAPARHMPVLYLRGPRGPQGEGGHGALHTYGSAVPTLHSTRTTTTRTRTAQAGTGLHSWLPRKIPRQQPPDQTKFFLDGNEQFTSRGVER